MRVILAIIKGLFFIGLLAGGVFLIAREVLLWQGVTAVSNAANRAVEFYRSPSQYYDQCMKKGNARESLPRTVFQVRFITSKDFQVEVVCPQFPSDPIVLETVTLPKFVVKSAGSSGLIAGEYTTHAVTLAIFGRQQSVWIENQKIKNRIGAMTLDPGPVTSCEGWGYQCCQAETSVGQGQAQPMVSDCARSCYQTCQPRPIVLSFTTDPFMDLKTRVTPVGKGQAVSFNWVVEVGQGQELTGSIDYGDGQTESFADQSGMLSHQYQCLENSCFYQAKIKVIDQNQVESAPTGITQIGIRIE